MVVTLDAVRNLGRGPIKAWRKEVWRRYKIHQRSPSKPLTPEQHQLIKAYIRELRRKKLLPKFMMPGELNDHALREQERFSQLSMTDLSIYKEEHKHKEHELSNLVNQFGWLALPLPDDNAVDPSLENIAQFVFLEQSNSTPGLDPVEKYIECWNDHEKWKITWEQLLHVLQYFQTKKPRPPEKSTADTDIPDRNISPIDVHTEAHATVPPEGKRIKWTGIKSEFARFIADEYEQNPGRYKSLRAATFELFSKYDFDDKKWRAEDCYDLVRKM